MHSPIVRRHAAELRVDLSTVTGTGPSGTVTRADVERAASGRHRLSPRARRLATDLGVDTGELAGTGPAGVVTGADVERAAAGGGAAAVAPTVGAHVEAKPAPIHTADRTESMRRAIATRMARANLEIPHYYLENRVDFSRARRVARRRERGSARSPSACYPRCCCSRRPRSRLGRFRS